MQPRKQAIHNATENEQIAKQREVELDLWLRGLQTSDFHPNGIFNPVDELPPEQDPFIRINADAKHQALLVSQYPPVSMTSQHFESAQPADMSQLSSQLKRKFQPQEIAIADTFEPASPQHYSMGAITHGQNATDEAPHQVMFEPDPSVTQFGNPSSLSQPVVTTVPIEMTSIILEDAHSPRANPSVEGATQQDDDYYFIDRTRVPKEYKIVKNSNYKFSFITVNGQRRMVYKNRSVRNITLYFADGTPLTQEQLSNVRETVSKNKIVRVIPKDGVDVPVGTKKQFKLEKIKKPKTIVQEHEVSDLSQMLSEKKWNKLPPASASGTNSIIRSSSPHLLFNAENRDQISTPSTETVPSQSVSVAAQPRPKQRSKSSKSSMSENLNANDAIVVERKKDDFVFVDGESVGQDLKVMLKYGKFKFVETDNGTRMVYKKSTHKNLHLCFDDGKELDKLQCGAVIESINDKHTYRILRSITIDGVQREVLTMRQFKEREKLKQGSKSSDTGQPQSKLSETYSLFASKDRSPQAIVFEPDPNTPHMISALEENREMRKFDAYMNINETAINDASTTSLYEAPEDQADEDIMRFLQ